RPVLPPPRLPQQPTHQQREQDEMEEECDNDDSRNVAQFQYDFELSQSQLSSESQEDQGDQATAPKSDANSGANENSFGSANVREQEARVSAKRQAHSEPTTRQSAASTTVTSLFQTGRGADMMIDSDAVQRAAQDLAQEQVAAPSKKVPLRSAKEQKPRRETKMVGMGSVLSQAGSAGGNLNSVAIDSNALERAASELASGAHQDTRAKPSLFQTGRGEKVAIDSKALERATRQLASGVKPQDAGAPSSLFQTGNGSAVAIDPQALNRAAAKLGGCGGAAEAGPHESASLFQTGRGVNVAISDAAMSKASELLEDGESTPSGKRLSAPATKEARLGAVKRRKPFVTPVQTRRHPHRPQHHQQVLSKQNTSLSVPSYKRTGRSGGGKSGFVTPFKQQGARNKQVDVLKSAPGRLVQASPRRSLGVVKRIAALDERLKLKQVKRYTVLTGREVLSAGVPRVLLNVTPDNAARLSFDVGQGDGRPRGFSAKQEDQGWKQAFGALSQEPGMADVREHWVFNHTRWVVWKLAAFERSFPELEVFSGCCSFENLMEELRYRFDREILGGQRPILRKVLEKDAPASAHMVLCLARLPRAGSKAQVTDGWYAVQADLDHGLEDLVRRGKLAVGDKFHVGGATLCGNEHGVDPLEIECNLNSGTGDGKAQQPWLCISRNGTRPAPWHAKLGLQRDPMVAKGLHQVADVVGTSVACLSGVMVCRVFPLRFCEKESNGTRWITRTLEEEQAEQKRFDEQLLRVREVVLAEIESGWDEICSQGSESASQLSERARRQTKVAEDRNREVAEALENDPRLPRPRQVKTKHTLLITARPDTGQAHFAELVIWNAPEEIVSLREGTHLDVISVTVHHKPHQSNIGTAILHHLGTGKQTRFVKRSAGQREGTKEHLQQTRRQAVPIEQITSAASPFVDTAGVVLFADERFAFLAGKKGVLALSSWKSYPGLAALGQPGAVVALRDILFTNVDSGSGFVGCTATPHSQASAQFNGSATSSTSRRQLWNHLATLHQSLVSGIATDAQTMDIRRRQVSGAMDPAIAAAAIASRPVVSRDPLPSPVSSSSSTPATTKEHRLKIQQAKQQEWRARHRGLLNGPPRRKEPLCLKVNNVKLTAIMLGNKKVDVRSAEPRIKTLRNGDVIMYTDTIHRQLVRVKAAIPYRNPAHAMQHENLRSVAGLSPASALPAQDDVLADLLRHLGADQPVYAVHFEAQDHVRTPS
ncbi:Breast cancer type 2 susceptibility protein homolog (Fanconi anemia group D1 protein homolog), partial [Durusdinium trenchii]